MSNMEDEEWINIDRNLVYTIHIFLIGFVFFNVVKENTTKYIWEQHGRMYTKSPTNKVFLIFFYHIRMGEGLVVVYHLNEPNPIIKKLVSVCVKFEDGGRATI